MSGSTPSPRLHRIERDFKVAIALWAMVAVFCAVMANVLAASLI
jgi:hypothetical protein